MAPSRLVPVILTLVPPAPGPLDGFTVAITGWRLTMVQVNVVEPELDGTALSVAVTVT